MRCHSTYIFFLGPSKGHNFCFNQKKIGTNYERLSLNYVAYQFKDLGGKNISGRYLEENKRHVSLSGAGNILGAQSSCLKESSVMTERELLLR